MVLSFLLGCHKCFIFLYKFMACHRLNCVRVLLTLSPKTTNHSSFKLAISSQLQVQSVSISMNLALSVPVEYGYLCVDKGELRVITKLMWNKVACRVQSVKWMVMQYYELAFSLWVCQAQCNAANRVWQMERKKCGI